MLQIMQELVQMILQSLDLYEHTAAGIGNETAQVQPLGQVVHERAKPDTLDDAVNQQAQPLTGWSNRGTGDHHTGIRNVSTSPLTTSQRCICFLSQLYQSVNPSPLLADTSKNSR